MGFILLPPAKVSYISKVGGETRGTAQGRCVGVGGE